MFRGYFSPSSEGHRPFIRAVLEFPTLSVRPLLVELLVDTGADNTILAPLDARRLSNMGVNLSSLATGGAVSGVGGSMATRTVAAVLTIDSFSTPFTLTVVPPPPLLAFPSLLGRDILSQFALFLEEQTERVILLTPEEAAELQFPQARGPEVPVQ